MFDRINYSFFIIIAVIMLFPLWNVIIISLVDYRTYVKNPLVIWPREVTLNAYRMIFASSEIPRAFFVSVLTTSAGTLVSMIVSVSGAYALSKSRLPGRNIFFVIIIFTMFFNGGLVPTFLVMRGLNLNNSLWILVLFNGVMPMYLIIIKNYFVSLPHSLEESAKIDGAHDFTILFRIIIPLSMPIIATFTLFYSVFRWNDWYTALIYISDPFKYPLPLIMRNMIVKNQVSFDMLASYSEQMMGYVSTENMKMATVVVATLPILLVYPFLQKHFAKGIMIGAIKS